MPRPPKSGRPARLSAEALEVMPGLGYTCTGTASGRLRQRPPCGDALPLAKSAASTRYLLVLATCLRAALAAASRAPSGHPAPGAVTFR